MNLKELIIKNKELYNKYPEFGAEFQMKEFTREDWDKWLEIVEKEIIPNNRIILDIIGDSFEELASLKQHIVTFEEWFRGNTTEFIPYPEKEVELYLEYINSLEEKQYDQVRSHWYTELSLINHPNMDKLMKVCEQTIESYELQKNIVDLRGLSEEDKGIVDKLNKFEHLSPITLEDNEWNHIIDTVYQSKRNPNIFRDEKGVYLLNAVIGIKPSGEEDYIIVDGIEYDMKAYMKDLAFDETIFIDIDNNREVINKEDLDEVKKHYELIQM